MKLTKRIIDFILNVLLLFFALVGAAELGTWLSYIIHKPAVTTVMLMMV